MNVLDLFAGIGGFSLGLERAGMKTVAFCEIEPYCRAVLRKHWPDVPIYDDVRTLTAARLAADGILSPDVADAGREYGDGRQDVCAGHSEFDRPRFENRQEINGYIERSSKVGVDLICGGFPCQDISVAGKGAGIEGERSGLWSEYARIIGEVRPRYVIVENVAALLGRGLSRVLGDLSTLGYDAEWHCIPASAVGAPHRRDRLWIVAYAGGGVLRDEPGRCNAEPRERQVPESRNGAGARDVADAELERLQRSRLEHELRQQSNGEKVAGGGWWIVEPDVGRVAHGVPARVDRLRALGNAVVSQIPEIIGRAIMGTL